MKTKHTSSTLLSLLILFASTTVFVQCKSETKEAVKETVNETNLIAPDGFSVFEIGKDLGAVRHLTVAPNGDIYANRKALKDGKAIVALKDNNNDGKIDSQENFGELPGTEVLVKNGYLYASSNSGIYRYKMNANHEIIDTNAPEQIVGGLIDMGRDNAKPFTMDGKGNIYVTVGSWNDPCRDAEDKTGMNPCTILDSAAGIWKFRADKLNQTYADGSRYVTGLKNPVGLDWNTQTNSLFATDHGRGKLHLYYPDLYTQQQDNDLPAETFYELKENDNAGWPYTYYDHIQKARIVSPEYGGDGKKTGGEDAIDPIMAFPAHYGPNDVLFYTGDMFPERYKNGAFIAFHGQNKTLSKGYFVAFIPFENGKPTGKWEVFLDNFAGINLANPQGELQHRPCGLAQGPDGALYIADDHGGSIFKVTY